MGYKSHRRCYLGNHGSLADRPWLLDLRCQAKAQSACPRYHHGAMLTPPPPPPRVISFFGHLGHPIGTAAHLPPHPINRSALVHTRVWVGRFQVPTIRGAISVNATPAGVTVLVPCGSSATLCVPRSSAIERGGSAGDSSVRRLVDRPHVLLLDGVSVGSVAQGGHSCVAEPVGCGVAGAARWLTYSVLP